jgi:hypothetical protein
MVVSLAWEFLPRKKTKMTIDEDEDLDEPIEEKGEPARFVAPHSGTITWSAFRSLSDPEKHAFIERGGIVAGL